jgi:hypothetical protein
MLPFCLPWIKGISNRFPDKNKETQHHGKHRKGRDSKPWRLEIGLSLIEEFTQRRDPGGSPKPRKSRAVRVVIEPFRMNGRNVSAATMALGRICLNMIMVSLTPRALAART